MALAVEWTYRNAGLPIHNCRCQWAYSLAKMIENKKLTALQNSVYERESMRDEPSRRELAKTLHQVIERAGTNDRDSRQQPESEISSEADCLV